MSNFPMEKRPSEEQVPQLIWNTEEEAHPLGVNGWFGYLLNQLVMIRHQNLTTSLSE